MAPVSYPELALYNLWYQVHL